MGIILDFLILKQQIEEYKETGGILHNISFYNKKKKLFEIAEKLLKANEPLDKDAVLELAQSLHGLSVGYDNGFYDKRVKVEYFPGNESYRLSVLNFEDSDIEEFKVIVSDNQKDMEIFVSIKESEDVSKGYRLNNQTIYTNIKELKDYISTCNKALYLLIYDYVHDILAQMC